MIIAGIDPGLTGAIAWVCAPDGALIETADMPVFALTKAKKASRIVDAYQVAALLRRPLLRRHQCGHVCVEVQQTRPGQSAQAVAKTFTNYGVLLGVIAALGIPYTPANPRVWKAALKVPAAKDGARARASELIPGGAEHWSLARHDGRAEAALIALWGTSYLKGTVC